VKLCGFEVGLERPLFLIAGPDTLESEQLCLDVAGELKERTSKLKMPYIFKEVASVVDVLQTPAFLCRQTNFIRNVAQQGKPMNVKKGQFLSPWEMKQVVDKARSTGNQQVMVCERGFSFGYNNLVVDMRGLAVMRETGCPVVFDATHSVQLPGGQGTSSGGQREHISVLARAAVAAGVSGVFMETHPKPDEALCDGPNSWPLALMGELLETLAELDRTVKKNGFIENKVKTG
jgi:2-dehydro-3-deoxyphosphooctonate aldolase (KDO 8-P synthase)